MHILLLEDELMLNESICEYFTAQGHTIVGYLDGKEALTALGRKNFELLILDINVPTIDGLTLLEQLHAKGITTPTIYISALVDIEDISRAYALGCNDYLKKPFHLKELSLRVARILDSAQHTPTLWLKLSAHYSYDQEHSTLLYENEPQILTKRQSQIVDLLARNRGRVVDFEQFRIYVWEHEPIDDASIRAEVNRLKKSLHEAIIHNVRGMGYMIDKA
ncbi:MAG: regulator [Sulfuricurvum sp. PC08-66]|nr:MAG: regulator [Sulfuricurvum sp. PC08-66]